MPSIEDFEDVIIQEARRSKKVPGLDFEDVVQELRLSLFLALPRLNGENTGRTYMRRVAQNRIKNLLRDAYRESRCSRIGDSPKLPLSLDAPLAWEADPCLSDASHSPDSRVNCEYFLDILQQGLDRVGITNPIRLGKQRALAARQMVEDVMAEIEEAIDEELTVCHVRGSEPEGYSADPETAAELCQHCEDKYTCLPETIAASKAGDERFPTPPKLASDPEVKAYVGNPELLPILQDRTARRLDLVLAKNAIPDDLRVDNLPASITVGDVDIDSTSPVTTGEEDMLDDTETVESTDEELEAEVDEEIEAEEETETPKPRRRKSSKTTKKASAKKAAKKSAAAKKAPAKKAAKKAPAPGRGPSGEPRLKANGEVDRRYLTGDERGGKEAVVMEDGSLHIGEYRIGPPPKKLDAAQMQIALERLNLGLPFDLEPGMILKKTYRSGEVLEVKLRKYGFELDGELYSSLSAACCWATLTSVSGNELFNFEKKRGIEIRGRNVPDGVYRSDDHLPARQVPGKKSAQKPQKTSKTKASKTKTGGSQKRAQKPQKASKGSKPTKTKAGAAPPPKKVAKKGRRRSKATTAD